MRRLGRWALRLVGVLLVLVLLAASVGAVFYQRYVVLEPGEHLEREHILQLIAQESPVFYRDGTTPIGVFFADEHRQYVRYQDIPPAWVQAITAAEDQRYFQHFGVDLQGLARAMKQNLLAGQMVSGGSTLTMQTSENLFHPGTYTLHGKAWEVIDALRLEHHYSKEEILEFYANQFHVYGNGRGLGIAARYFFDKEVTALDIQECAFLAGLVKIPGRYNPFIGSTEEKRAQARDKAQTRVRYVLRRMYEEGHLTEAQLQEYSERPIPFRKGSFRYDRSVVLDEVERQLEAAPFPELLARAGIQNPSTAGMRVITTLDAQAQRAATYGLWHHLSEAGPALEGAAVQDWLHPASKAPIPDPNDPPLPYGFRYAAVRAAGAEAIGLDLGGFEGLLDAAALDRAAVILATAQGGDRGAKPTAEQKAALRAALTPGTVVWVSTREERAGVWLCDLELRPELQGAVVVLEEGQVRAMVGGNDNRNLNRAVAAKRQLGSTWKVLVYHAALQLGWAPTDVLDNRRAVFPFQTTWYYPKPDHASEDFVSLSWAGVRSENLATIWLLVHLTDRLNPEQLRRLAQRTDLARRAGEDAAAYRVRIRDTHGVVLTEDSLDELLFVAARDEVLGDLNFTGHPEDAIELRSMHHGRGFAGQAERVRKGSGGKEREQKLAALELNLLALEALLPECEAQAARLVAAAQAAAAGTPSALPAAEVSALWVRPVGERVKLSCGRAPEGWARAESFAAGLDSPPPLPVSADPLLLGRVHASTVRALRGAMEARRPKLAGRDLYDEELVLLNPDVRTLIGLRYLAGLAKELGVQTELPPVLSLPLGAVDIPLIEAASLYQGLLTGLRYRPHGELYTPSTVPGLRLAEDVELPEGPPLLIAEIRDRDDNVIWRASPEPEEVADPVAGRLTADILRNVVLHGTARRALGAAGGLPIAGKTGTTNEYRNAAFIGWAPVADEEGLEATRALTVAAYVGYDDNRVMSRGGTRLQGASGALPAWLGTVEGLYRLGLLGQAPADPTVDEDGYARVPVDPAGGLPAAPGGDGSGPTVLVLPPAEAPSRRFAPYGDRAQQAEAAEEAPPVDLDVPVGEPEAPSDDTGGVEQPRLGTPPSVWDELEAERAPPADP